MGGETPSNPPVPLDQLSSIATEACDAALEGTNKYAHEKVGQWSSQIINKILQSLIDATTSTSTTASSTTTTTTAAAQPSTSTSTSPSPQYRFNVSCTIIQQGLGPEGSGAGAEGSEDPATGSSTGRRGMYSASGAYWDVQRDGMWTFKYPRAEEKGMDVVLNVVWFGTR